MIMIMGLAERKNFSIRMISCLETDLEKGKVPEQAATRRDYRAGIFHIFSRKFQNDSGFRRKTLGDLTLEPFLNNR